jgi:hypothetical protein
MKKKLSEEQIDEIVISQTDNDSEWEEAVHVRKKSRMVAFRFSISIG